MPYPELVLLVLDFARIAVDESVQTGEDTELCLYAGKDRLSEIQFGIMSDIAAEAWSKASARWKEINKEKLSFDAEVREAPDCQQQ